MITFAYPWFFLLIPLILLLGAWMMFRKKAALKIPSALPFERAGAVRRFHLNILEAALLPALLILTAALLCKLVESCAAPLLAFLLVEGFLRLPFHLHSLTLYFTLCPVGRVLS